MLGFTMPAPCRQCMEDLVTSSNPHPRSRKGLWVIFQTSPSAFQENFSGDPGCIIFSKVPQNSASVTHSSFSCFLWCMGACLPSLPISLSLSHLLPIALWQLINIYTQVLVKVLHLGNANIKAPKSSKQRRYTTQTLTHEPSSPCNLALCHLS